jgi:L-threonylcarbamoyladenylate synthase
MPWPHRRDSMTQGHRLGSGPGPCWPGRQYFSAPREHHMRTLDVLMTRTRWGQAAASLRAGSVVVVPTDTVYGLAARPDDRRGGAPIYRAKDGRPNCHLPVLAASLTRFVSSGSNSPTRPFGPGQPLVARTADHGVRIRRSTFRPEWLAGREEVAVRIPNHAFLLAPGHTGCPAGDQRQPHGSPPRLSAHEAAARPGDPCRASSLTEAPCTTCPSTLVNVRGGPRGRARGGIGRDDHRGTHGGRGEPASWPLRRRVTRRRRRSSATPMRCGRRWWPARSTCTPPSVAWCPSWPAGPTSR